MGSWPGLHHQYWGAALNGVPEPLHLCVVLFSLAAPYLSLSLFAAGLSRNACVVVGEVSGKELACRSG